MDPYLYNGYVVCKISLEEIEREMCVVCVCVCVCVREREREREILSCMKGAKSKPFIILIFNFYL